MSVTFGPHLYHAVRFHSFPGFYESHLSSELDHQEEQEVEHFVGDRQNDDGIPTELRLDEQTYTDILFDCADYEQMREDMAGVYADALDDLISERLGFWAGIHFHSCWSPREYNFGTDELTIWVPEPTLRALMVRSLVDGHDMLGAALIEMFSPRPGFIPSYSSDISEWIKKPLAEWDEIELGVLLEAVYAIGLDRHDEKLDKAATYAVCETERPYTIVMDNIDWTKVDEKVAEKRAELEEEHRATIDPDYVAPPVRCGFTPDLFRQMAA